MISIDQRPQESSLIRSVRLVHPEKSGAFLAWRDHNLELICTHLANPDSKTNRCDLTKTPNESHIVLIVDVTLAVMFPNNHALTYCLLASCMPQAVSRSCKN